MDSRGTDPTYWKWQPLTQKSLKTFSRAVSRVSVEQNLYIQRSSWNESNMFIMGLRGTKPTYYEVATFQLENQGRSLWQGFSRLLVRKNQYICRPSWNESHMFMMVSRGTDPTYCEVATSAGKSGREPLAGDSWTFAGMKPTYLTSFMEWIPHIESGNL